MVLKKSAKKTGFLATLVALFFLASPLNAGFCQQKAAEKKAHPKTSAQVSKGAVEKEKKKAADVKKELNQKAIKAIADTYKVLDLLNQKKSKEALDLLKKVIGELEVILAANKNVALIPINSYTVVVDTDLTPKQIAEKITEVKTRLNHGDVQGARILLDTLQSEIDIVIENLPLATYPDAMKLASKYIIDGKIDEARSVLQIALNSMVVKKIVIPIPLVRASDLIAEASKVAKTDKEQALKYLNEAKRQLELAKILGYGKDQPKVYKDLQERIDSIKKEIKGKNKAAKMFEELLKKLKEFKERLISS